MDATLKAFSRDSGGPPPRKAHRPQPSEAAVEAPPADGDALALSLERIPYRCARCERGLRLEENTTVICSCGWRIVLKDQKKLMRTFSTD